jgi:hypothetical protein
VNQRPVTPAVLFVSCHCVSPFFRGVSNDGQLASEWIGVLDLRARPPDVAVKDTPLGGVLAHAPQND